MSNVMKVLGDTAVQEPTKAEALVRAQMQKRQDKHLNANAERQLSDEQRRAKTKEKLRKDLTSGLYHMAVFR